jgi:propanol-preferring alcohol dehydrogenase
MRAVVLSKLKSPLTIENLPLPKPGAGEVRVKIAASGVCHTDLHVAEGDWTEMNALYKLPLILGHEGVGTVDELGPGVTRLCVGDRVGIAFLHEACGACDNCVEGHENFCPTQTMTGVTVDGCHAEYAIAKAAFVGKLPDGLGFREAAPLCCAGVTVYGALKRAQVRLGQRVAVVGIGGLGHLAVQIAKAMGGCVTAVDVADDKLALAKRLGADHVVNSRSDDAVQAMQAQGGMHVALVTSAASAAYQTAFFGLKNCSKLVVVGIPSEPLSISPILQIAKGVEIIPQAVGTRQDLAEVFALGATGAVRCETTLEPLERVNDVLRAMAKGQVLGRVVLQP